MKKELEGRGIFSALLFDMTGDRGGIDEFGIGWIDWVKKNERGAVDDVVIVQDEDNLRRSAFF